MKNSTPETWSCRTTTTLPGQAKRFFGEQYEMFRAGHRLSLKLFTFTLFCRQFEKYKDIPGLLKSGVILDTMGENDIAMGIDKDIQQSKFRNVHQKAAINIIYTMGWMRERTTTIFDAEDITPQQFNILRILRGSFPDPLSTLQIRERMLEKMSDTSRIVDRLIAKGLVKKLTCKKDRRLVDVIISDKGKKLLARLDKRQDEIDGVLGNLSDKEATDLSDLLDKIRDGGK